MPTKKEALPNFHWNQQVEAVHGFRSKPSALRSKICHHFADYCQECPLNMTLEICPSIWKQGQWHNLHFHLLLVRQDARMTMTTTRKPVLRDIGPHFQCPASCL